MKADSNHKPLTIAFVSHNICKKMAIDLSKKYQDFLSRCILVSTRGTGKVIMDEVPLHINCVNTGPMGGDEQIAALIVEGKIDFIVFLIDMTHTHQHRAGIRSLLRIASIYNILLATNYASANAILSSLEAADIANTKNSSANSDKLTSKL